MIVGKLATFHNQKFPQTPSEVPVILQEPPQIPNFTPQKNLAGGKSFLELKR